MRKINLILLLILTAFILQGCHHVFIHSTPGIRVRHTRVVKKPVYVEQEEYYEEDDQEYDEYEDAEEYEETEYVDEGYQDTGYQQAGYREYVETDVSVDIFVGTAFAIYGTPYIWCDYCCCWHPRCTLWRCYCHAVVIRHYGFYHNHRYMHHCYHWNYDPYYRPVISRFRIRHNTGRYYTYNVAQKQRDFRRRNGVGFSKERVRYRGKEEIKYTYNKSRSNDGSRRTVTRNGVSSSAKKTSV
ncbi:MAG: hypothetical protein GY863_20705, partial [bacterium]|nr:hypothetical protein [bacterium]